MHNKNLIFIFTLITMFNPFAGAANKTTDSMVSIDPKSSGVVGHYFGIFDDTWDVAWSDRVRSDTPFDEIDYLYIAFAHSYKDPNAPGKYVLGYENARTGLLKNDDTDAVRIDHLVDVSREKNPDIKIIISLGWGTSDILNISTDPQHYADSVVDFIRKHELDGFDLDFEPPQLPQQNEFTTIATTLRTTLDEAGEEDNKIYLLTVSPSTLNSYNNWSTLSEQFDYVNLQTYWSSALLTQYLKAGVPKNKITLGLLSEGENPKMTDIATKINLYETNDLAGLFAWRLDTDTLVDKKPTYQFAKEMKIQLDKSDSE
jgi:chitinase